jgi:hypothetical protein
MSLQMALWQEGIAPYTSQRVPHVLAKDGIQLSPHLRQPFETVIISNKETV